MTTRLYRFRPLSRLLDKGELLNQEVFFASPDTLNDPMEGFRDIFWQGDAIVWENLFRHYLLCVDWAYSFLSIGGEDQPISWNYIPILRIGSFAPTPRYQQRVDSLVASFLENHSLNVIIKALAGRATPVRRDELAAYLQPVHALALVVIQQNHRAFGLAKQTDPDPSVDAFLQGAMKRARELIDHAALLSATVTDPDRAISILFAVHREMIDEIKFLQRYNCADRPFDINRNFVLLEFPNEYVARLETLVYPEWYTACFMKECRDSSVWGSYGDNHTAACLIFKINESGGSGVLRLKRLMGYSNREPMIDFVPHRFEEVIYENKHLPVDFFRSLGRLPVSVVTDIWFTSRQGERSSCADDIFRDEEAWRQRYWETFTHGITRKLEAWHYEKEQRLILTGMLLDFDEPKNRVAQYDFSDLEGIIFGIKTPADKKIQICKIIEDKCRALKRTNFRFYQAYYSEEKGCIEHREMTLLRFDLSEGYSEANSEKAN